MKTEVREVGVLTTSRADFGGYLSVLEAMDEHPLLDPRLLVGGSHLDEQHGRTESEINAAGWRTFRRVGALGQDMAASVELALASMVSVLRDWRPEILLVAGDRFEMFAASVAAGAFRVPLAHIHGGDVTEGAIDDSYRHALTKLAHLHFCATEDAERRLRQLGEERWRITRSGSPWLDRFNRDARVDPGREDGFLLVTYHPVTQQPGHEGEQVRALIDALSSTGRPCVVTAPNADPGRALIDTAMREFCASDPSHRYIVSAGATEYAGLMATAVAMVGNSSSGLIEAASFCLPVVNIGTRQTGRVRGRNVCDCGYTAGEIRAAIDRAASADFRREVRGMTNPYGDGRAGPRIAARLAEVPIDSALLAKRFIDRSVDDDR